MAKGKANGVNATRTSFAASGKDYGSNSASSSYRKIPSIDTQEPLATQISARPPSRESIASQDGNVGGYTADSFESQEDLATQFYPLNTRQNIFRAAHTKPIMSNNANNKSMLLGLLDRGNRQKPLPEQHSQRSAVESSSRSTRKTPTTDSVASTTVNNVRDGRSPFKDSIHGSRPKPSLKQQSQRSASESSSRRTKQQLTPDMGKKITSNNRRDGRPPSENRHKSSSEQQPSSPNSTTNSNLGTNDEHDGHEKDVIIRSESKNATNSSQSQRRSISEARSSQRLNKSSEQSVERTDSNLENEVTSFQLQPPSSSENTAPMAENCGNSFDLPEERSNVTSTPLTEPARKEKSSHRDPWSSMKMLRRRDVVIPADQEELLERKDCWIPPDVGQPYPQGHVPPTLLQEWNTKMTRLFANARKTHTSSQKAEPSREQDDEQPPSSNSLPDESESESEAEVPWSPSPPRGLPKSVAPPDSPTRQDHDRELADITEKDINGIAVPTDGVDLETQTPPSGSQIDHSNDSTHRVDVSVDNHQGRNSNLSPEPLQSPSVAPQDEAVEPSDDSDMETTIPQALLVRSQDIASQIEFSEPPAPSSSNANFVPVGQVQILDTPAGILKRAAAKRAENALTHTQEWAPQQSSSGSNKSSSQLISSSLNNTEGSSGQEHQSQDAQRPFVSDSQITNGDLQGSSLSSHQDSQRLLEYIPGSSFQSPGPHTQVCSQHREPKERAGIDPSPSKTTENRKNLKRRAGELVDQVTEESPGKRARKLPDTNSDDSNIQNTLDIDHEASNQGNHEYAYLNKDALRVYDMFKRSYPRYAGNFDHFQALCFELQSLHRRGVLERSFFWDDFIMRHWVDYGTHVQKCISSGEDYEDYEDYFCRNFTRPSFRKRNLTPRALNIVVSSRLGSSKQKSVTVERGIQTFDDSLVSASVIRHPPLEAEQVSNFTLEKLNTQSATSDVIVLAARPHQANIGVKLSASPKKCSIVVGDGIQVDLQPPTPPHGLDGEPKHMRDEDRAVAETPPHAAIVDDDDIDHVMRESSPEDFTSDYHDTASVELGLETLEEALISHQEEEHENDPNIVEARFEQISRMRRDDVQAIQALFTADVPLAPEEEDANTPLKTWIRDDYNIVSERRRRGGYEVPLDKNGNVVIEEFPRVIDDGNEENVLPPSRRWLWPRQIRNMT